MTAANFPDLLSIDGTYPIKSTPPLIPGVEGAAMLRKRNDGVLRLRKALHKKGHLSSKIMNETPGLPQATTYSKYFGGLRKVYDLIGYPFKRDFDNVDS